MIGLAAIIDSCPLLDRAVTVQRMADSMCTARHTLTEREVFDGRPLTVACALNHEPVPPPCWAWNEDRTIGLIFAGEDYALPRDSMRGLIPTLLDLYDEHGLSFIPRLNGQFSGILFDVRKGLVTVFNDRYGLGRIYYHKTPERFYFATEAKALLAVLPCLRQLDPRSLAEFHALGCVLQDRSLFRDVHLLPPGSAWTFDRAGTLTRHRYFDSSAWEAQEPLAPEEYERQLAERFGEIVPQYTSDSNAVALSLTGGLDSRAVLAWARPAPGTLPCYTFGGPYRDCADVRIARSLARVCHQSHTTLRIGKDFFAEFDRLAEETVRISDGTMDVSGAVELYVNRLARAIAPIRLTGNYGSEIIRYNVALRTQAIDRSLYTPEFGDLLDQAVDTYRTELNCHPLTFIAFKQVPWHHFGRFSIERAELSPRSPFLDNELVALAFRAPAAFRGSPQPMLDLIAAGNPALAVIGTDRAVYAHRSRLMNRVTAGLQELTVKAEYAYDYGMPPWLARADHTVSRLHLERLFLGRHKFYHFRVWYRDRLRSYLQTRVLDAVDQPFGYAPGAARRLAREHLAGTANHTTALTKLLTIQQINKLLASVG